MIFHKFFISNYDKVEIANIDHTKIKPTLIRRKKLTLYLAARRANSWAKPSSGTPALTLNPWRSNVCAMRTPACPVAPATNTVLGSFRLDKPEEGLLTTGIKDLTSGIFPKSKRKGLVLAESSGWGSTEDESLLLPKRNWGKGPACLAKTVSLVFLRISLECGVGVRINELEVSVGAIDREGGNEISKATVCSDPITQSFWLKISHSHAYAYYFCLVLILSGCGGKGSLANGVEPRGHSLSTKRRPAPNVLMSPLGNRKWLLGTLC